MVGVAVSDAMLSAARAQQALVAATPPQPQAPPAGAPPPSVAMPDPGAAGVGRVGASKTMLGVASPLSTREGAALGAIPAEAAPRGRTMLGVAIPGIAPTSPGPGVDPGPASLGPAGPASVAADPMSRAGGTMLGVAIPGIAPLAPGAAPPAGAAPPPSAAAPFRSKVAHTAIAEVAVLPPPAPFVDDVPVPEAPVRREKRGVPVAVVAALVGGILVVGGGTILLLARAAPPIVAQGRVDAQGNDVLHLQCANCADGTTATLGGAKAEFKGYEAELPLAKPLEVGDNHLDVAIDRPGAGRDETVKLVVPVPFRIRADLADIGAKPPVITVRVAAAPGTQVSVDGKPLSLDGSGKGAYAIDVTSDTEGPTEETKVIDRKVPYSVTPPGGKAESGEVNARIAVAPLRLDAPSPHAVVAGSQVMIAGQTVAGGSVTLDGKPATIQADGSFADTHDAPSSATTSIELRASAQGRAPRTVHLALKRVASLEAEAKAAEKTPLLTYDQVALDIASKVGQRAVVAGEVLEARTAGHQTVALIIDTRGCAVGPCVARVISSVDA
jgi:hypothetical protein